MSTRLQLMCDIRSTGHVDLDPLEALFFCHSTRDASPSLSVGNLSAEVWIGVKQLHHQALAAGWRRAGAKGNGGAWACPACLTTLPNFKLAVPGRVAGGHARAAKLTPERRTEIARNAALTRHGRTP